MRRRNFIALFLMIFAIDSATMLSWNSVEAATVQQGQPIEHKLPAGGKVTIRQVFGELSVIGVSGDTVTIEAKNDDGEPAEVKVMQEAQDLLISTEVDGARRKKRAISLEVKIPSSANLTIESQAGEISVVDITGQTVIRAGGGEINLVNVGSLVAATGGGEVTVQKVTGNVEIRTGGGELQVSDVSGAVSLITGGGEVTTSNTGDLEVRTGGGDVVVQDVHGSASIATGSGDLVVSKVEGNCELKSGHGDASLRDISGNVALSNVSGDVVAQNIGGNMAVASISADMDLKCVKGRVEVRNASGSVQLAHIGGDIEVTSTSGDVTLSTEIAQGNRYRIKTTSGNLLMMVPESASGFSVNLSSYTGTVESNLKLESSTSTEKKLTGQYGEGRGEIVLDTFSGSVSLKKGAVKNQSDCGKKSE